MLENSLIENGEWEEMSDCSAEIPSENEEEIRSSTKGAAGYQPQKYSAKYKDAADLLKSE